MVFPSGFVTSVVFCLLLYSCSGDPALELFQKAETLLGKGNYHGAIEGYRRVVKEYPESPYASISQYKLGFVYNRHLKDVDKALDAYMALFYLYPDSKETVQARKDMAGIYSELGDHRRAIEEYQFLLEEGPPARRADYQYLIAMEYIKLNDFQQARVELRELLDIVSSPEFISRIYYQLANTYFLEGRLNEAIETYSKVIEKAHNQSMVLEARLGKAIALEELGRLTDALSILKGLMEVYPNREAISTRIEWIEKRLKEGPKTKKKRRKKR